MISLPPQNLYWQQLRALLSVNIKMDFRGHRAYGQRLPKLSPLAWNLIMYTFMSGFLSLKLVLDTDPSQTTFLLLSYSMVMTFFAVLMETGHTLVNPEDSEILVFRPLHPKVYFTAKLLNIAFYVFLITLSLGLLPSITGSFQFGYAFGFITFPLLFLANLWSTAFVILIYAGLVKILPYQRFKDTLAFVQMGFAFILFFVYNLIPRVAWQSLNTTQFTKNNWLIIFPSTWFAGLTHALFGSPNSADWLLASLAIGSFALLILGTFKRLSFSFSQKLLLLQSDTAAEETSLPGKSSPFSLLEQRLAGFFLRSKEALAGFRLSSLFLKRDRSVKLSIYPLLGFPLAFLALALFENESQSLFTSSSFKESTIMIHGSIIFLFLMIYSLLKGMTFTSDWEASWIYSVAPLQSPGRLFQGIQFTILLKLMIPFFIVYGIAYSLIVSASNGLFFTIQLFALSVLGLTIAPFLIKEYPFSQKRQKGEGTRSFVMIIFIMPFWGLSLLIQKLAARFSWGLWVSLIFLLGIACIMERLSIGRLNRILSTKELIES